MKINLYGSNANMAYVIAKFLRRKGQDANVFIDKYPPYACNFPFWEEGDKTEFPAWVKLVTVDFKRSLIRSVHERKFLKELSDCDIIHVIGEAGIWASFTNRPYLYWSYGFDLDVLPFKNRNIKDIFLSYLQKRALRKANLILYPMPHQVKFVEKLRLTKAKFFLPMVPIDTEKYKARSSTELSRIRESYQCDWLLLHPSRQEWTRDIPDNKGNDKLYKAFMQFVKSGKNAKMIVFEKGTDVAESKKLIANLGLENKIIWLKEQNKESLINLYSISDIVFDQFTIGSPGLVTWEALSVGIPTFVYMSDAWNNCTEELPPIINVRTEEQILNMLSEFCADKALCSSISIASRDWIIKYFHWEKVIGQYNEYYEGILNN